MNPKLGQNPAAVSPTFTALQGQYLAFIHAYTCIFKQPPAEADMQRHFNVTPPSVHQMVVTLEKRGLITRQPGIPRSIRLALPAEILPVLR
jgi:DNA-binding MarR family transcriptional regulator